MIYANSDVLLTGYLTLVLVCLAAFFVWFMSTSGTRYWQFASGVPYVAGWPLVGNFLDAFLFRKSTFELMDGLYRNPKVDGGKLFGVSILMQPALVLRDPELVKQMLIKDATYFSNRYMCTDRLHDTIGYYNLLMIRNPHWKQLRAFLTPSLSLNKIKRMYSLVDQVGAPTWKCDKHRNNHWFRY